MGMGGAKNKALKKRIKCFSVSYLMHFPIVVQSLHSVQALPDSGDKLSPVSITVVKLNDAQTGLASAKKKTAGKINCVRIVTGVRLQITENHPYTGSNTSINVSRTVTSKSKQKRVNAHGHNSVTSYFDDEMGGAFYS